MKIKSVDDCSAGSLLSELICSSRTFRWMAYLWPMHSHMKATSAKLRSPIQLCYNWSRLSWLQQRFICLHQVWIYPYGFSVTSPSFQLRNCLRNKSDSIQTTGFQSRV